MPEVNLDIADVIRNFGQAMGARLIPEGTSPELADLLPTETDAELAKLGAELAAQIAALDNPTETDTAKLAGDVTKPLDLPRTCNAIRVDSQGQAAVETVAATLLGNRQRCSGGRFPARESDAPGVAWSGAGMPQLPRDQAAYITDQRQHQAGRAEREPNRAPHRSPTATPGTAGGK
jgi:hypothetical protein